jgi:hypothetical protein
MEWVERRVSAGIHKGAINNSDGRFTRTHGLNSDKIDLQQTRRLSNFELHLNISIQENTFT